MNGRRIGGSAVGSVLLLAAFLQRAIASAQDPTPVPENRPHTAADRMPVYKPPAVGMPASTTGGAPRGMRVSTLLAPKHVGLTTQAQPTLYWHLAQPIAGTVEFALAESGQKEPAWRVALPSSPKVGLHAVRLNEYQIRLRPGAQYEWSIEAAPPPGSRDEPTIARAAIRRIEASAQLTRRLRHAPTQEAVFIYAAAGVWYDALDAVSQAIAAHPDAPMLRAQRAALLTEVGLSDLLVADGASVPLPPTPPQ